MLVYRCHRSSFRKSPIVRVKSHTPLPHPTSYTTRANLHTDYTRFNHRQRLVRYNRLLPIRFPFTFSYRLHSVSPHIPSHRWLTTAPKEQEQNTLNQENPSTAASWAQKTKQFLKTHGRIGVITYLAVDAAFFGTLFTLIHLGVPIESAMEWIGWEPSGNAKKASAFALAFAVNKVLMPVRVGTVAIILRWIFNRRKAQSLGEPPTTGHTNGS